MCECTRATLTFMLQGISQTILCPLLWFPGGRSGDNNIPLPQYGAYYESKAQDMFR